MNLLKIAVVIAIFLVAAGCGGGTLLKAEPGSGRTAAGSATASAVTATAPSSMTARGNGTSASEAPTPTPDFPEVGVPATDAANPDMASPDAASSDTASSPSEAVAGPSVTESPAAGTGEANGQAGQEDKDMWSRIDKALAGEDYSAIVAEYRTIQSPSEDLTAMYNLAMYNIYGQAGDDGKSLECLYHIPADYQGRHADMVAYWKFIHESYAQGRTDNITFDEYNRKYYKFGNGVH